MKFEVNDLQMLRACLDVFCNFLEEADIAEQSIFDSRLVLSELAGNVLRHAGEKAHIQGAIVNGKIEVEVNSESRFLPPEQSKLPDLYAEHGRGLYLVDEVGEKRIITPAGGIRVIIKTTYKNQNE